MLTIDAKTLMYLKKGNLNRLSIHRSAPIVPDISGPWLLYGEKMNRTCENTEASVFKPESYADVIFIEQNGNSCSIKSTLKSGSTSLGMITPEGNMLVSSNPQDNTMTSFNFQKDENEEVVGLTGVYTENAFPYKTEVPTQQTEVVQEQNAEDVETEVEENQTEVEENETQVQQPQSKEHTPSVAYFFAERVKLDKVAVRKAKKFGLLPEDY